MDFLRIESEMDFIALLPVDKRSDEINSWYQDSNDDLQEYFDNNSFFLHKQNNIEYTTDNPKAELFTMLKEQYEAGLSSEEKAQQQLHVDTEPLATLNQLPNSAVQQLSQVSFILVEDAEEGKQLFSLIRNNVHKNVSSLFLETKMRLRTKDNAEIFYGLLSNYPEVIFTLKASQQAAFSKQFSEVVDAASYAKLLDKYAVRRSNKNFWAVSDKIHRLYLQSDAIRYGLFDYNRLDNR